MVEDVVEDDDFNSEVWVSVANYMVANGGSVTGCLEDIENFLKKGKLDQVVAIVKSCSSSVLSDLTVTIKDLSGTIPGTVHHKVIGEGGYGKDITVEAALILANDTFPRSGSGVGGSGMLMEEEEIVKLMEEEMVDLELHVCGNVANQEMADEEALNLALDKAVRQARAEQEWLDNCAKEEAFVRVLCDQCDGLRMTNIKDQRDSTKLGVLEQLLVGTHVGIGLKVFHKDTFPRSGSGVGGSGMLMEEKEIVKLMEEEMVDLELQVCGNVTNQEMADEEALNLVLDKAVRQARAEQEWLDNVGKKKCWMRNMRDNYRAFMEHFKLYHLVNRAFAFEIK
nr:hypothetical protein [Tanacetum cinerariifolium]